jgi:ABC-type Fe3+ transport system substrate-binding protein
MGNGKHHRVRSITILIAVIALVAAACGSDADEPAATTTTPTTTVAATTTTAGDTPAETTTTVIAVEAAKGLAAVCELGQAEGGFIYWATIEPDNFQRIIVPFKARYPGIAIEQRNLQTEDSAQIILTQVAAGQDVEPDVVYGSLDGWVPLFERDLVDTDYDWTAVDVADDLIDATNLVRVLITGLGLAYNTDLSTPADLPDSWEALIDEKYAKDLVVDPRGNPFDLLVLAWGLDATVDYITRLVATVDPIIIKGGTAGMTEIIAGGALMTSSGRSDSEGELQAEGAPIAMHYTKLVPAKINFNGLMANSDKVNAAACFVGWLATDEGKDSFETVEFKTNVFPPPGAPDDAIIVSIRTAADALLVTEAQALIADILAGG